MKRFMTALLLVLLSTLIARADGKTRVFVDSVEYVGPQVTINDVLYVDAAQFASQTGWSEAHRNGAVAIAPEHAVLPDGASGLYVGGQPFNGKTEVQNGALFVSLPELVGMLGGSLKPLAQFHAVRVTDVPGMPNPAALKGRSSRQMVSVELKTGTDFTLVEFFASW